MLIQSCLVHIVNMASILQNFQWSSRACLVCLTCRCVLDREEFTLWSANMDTRASLLLFVFGFSGIVIVYKCLLQSTHIPHKYTVFSDLCVNSVKTTTRLNSQLQCVWDAQQREVLLSELATLDWKPHHTAGHTGSTLHHAGVHSPNGSPWAAAHAAGSSAWTWPRTEDGTTCGCHRRALGFPRSRSKSGCSTEFELWGLYFALSLTDHRSRTHSQAC